MSHGTRIDDEGDFQNLALYKDTGPDGEVFKIVFKNWEEPGGWLPTVVGLSFIVFVFVSLVFIWGAFAAGIIPGLIWLAVLIFGFKKVKVPWHVNRVIEFEPARGLMRFYAGGRLEQQHSYQNLHNLTIEPHPAAEIEREARRDKREKAPSKAEKQHCLVGWFGSGGGVKKILITRWEWPNNNSLFEVRQGINSMLEFMRLLSIPGSDGAGAGAEDTIKPPLD